MTTATASARPAPALNLSPALRVIVQTVGIGFTALCLYTVGRALAGYAPDHPGAHLAAVIVHLSTAIPAIPLGAWLMLSRKGTPRHRALGKVWVGLMVVTACAAFFIRQINGGDFSPIHIFVPLTLYGAWQTIATARRHDIAAHRSALVKLYLGALIIPGAFTFLPGRLMGTWLLG